MYCTHCQKVLPEPIPGECPFCGEKLTEERLPRQSYAPNQEPLDPTPRPIGDQSPVREPEQGTPVPISAEKTHGRNPMMIVFAAVLIVALLGALVFGAITLLGKKSGDGSGKNGGSQAAAEKAPVPGIHSYEFVQDDCTWHEAQKKAVEKGGHLVCFETREEYEYVLGKLPKVPVLCYFRIGARRNLDATEYRWVDGSDAFFGEVLNSEDAWNADVWKEGEPNLTWSGVSEAYCVLRYDWDELTWNWVDAPDEVSESLDPETVGYIIEYEPAD